MRTDIKFAHEITSDYIALADGVQFDSLRRSDISQSIESKFYTRLSKPAADLIFKFVISYCCHFNIEKIYRSSDGTHGIFNIFDGENVSDFTKRPDRSEFDDRKVLFCSDFTEWQSLGSYNEKVRFFLSNVRKDDSVILAVDEQRLSIYKEKFWNAVEDSGFFINEIFFFIPTVNTPLLSPANEEIADWNHLNEYKSGVYFLNLGKEKTDQILVKMLDEQAPLESFFIKDAASMPHPSIKQGLILPSLQFCGYTDYTNRQEYENNRAEISAWLQERNERLTEYEEIIFSSLLDFESIEGELSHDGQNENTLFFSWGNVWRDETELKEYSRKASNFAYNTFYKYRANSINRIRFKSDRAVTTYFYHFFKSTFGRLYLQSFPFSFWKDGANLEDFHFRIRVPSIRTQLGIVSSIEKLDKVKKSLTELSFDGLLDPASSNDITTKINSLAEVAGSLSDAEAIMNMIERGESKTLEFKETLSWSIRENKKATYIQDEVVGTITAFLNTPGGGILLIGVSDRGELKGIETEIKNLASSYDKYLLTLNNLIAHRVGKEFFSYVDWKLITIGGKSLVSISCKKSPRPVWAGQERLFVRTNPATHQLSGPALLAYIKENFPDHP